MPMTIHISIDSRRAMHLKVLHDGGSYDMEPMNRASLDFLFGYIEALEHELGLPSSTDGPVGESGRPLSLAESDPYYRARAVAKFGKASSP